MEKCQFCDDGYHKSKECKKYPTDGDRKIIADKKKFCRFCFIKSDKLHLPNIKECPTNEKCIGWYSTDHHAVFCPERVKGMAQNLFFPKIDRDLLQRFIEAYELEEQLAFGLSSQNAQKYVPLKNIKIANSFYDVRSSGVREPLTPDDIIIVIRNLRFNGTNKGIIFKKITWKVRNIEIGTLNISVQELSQIIGLYTKEITIGKMNSKIKFAEIIRNAPNIEVLEIFDKSWISNQTTWLEDLYKYKEGKNFRELLIYLNTIEFNIETLKKFVETKSTNGVIIKIRYKNRIRQYEFHRFGTKMSKIFIKNSCRKNDETPHIILEFDGIKDVECYYFGPPLKKRQKINK